MAALNLTALLASAQGQSSVTLAWDPSPSRGIAGYRLYLGNASRTYTNKTSVGLVTSNTVSGLRPGATYFFAVTAYDVRGLESDFSSEISYTVPSASSSPPTITLTSPASGSTYTEPATIDLAATVAANGHSIKEVQFYNGPILLAADTAAPYTFTWNNVSAGTYSLSAKAVYDSGSTVSSAASSAVVAAARRPSVLTFSTDSGSLTAPFSSNKGVVSQPLVTGVSGGGGAVYTFSLLNGGNYLVSATVVAPSLGQNSFYVNIDNEPTDPLMVWDIPVCTSPTRCFVSWRGNGNGDPASSQYAPKVFSLSAGTHQLIVRGREANTLLGTISIVATPPKIKIQAAPGGAVALAAAGQPGQTYGVACSQDLKTWAVVGTVTLDATGSGKFTDPAGSRQSPRLYRLQNVIPAPPQLQIQATSAGDVVLSGTGRGGQAYNVVSSLDLKTWTLIGTVTLDSSGAFTFTDSGANKRPNGFYRLQ